MEGCLKAIGLLVILTLLLGLPVMLLWDWLMPTIFGLPTITFWQACGLNLLCSLLFKTKNYVSK